MIKLIKSFISLIAPKLSKVLRGSRGRFFKRAPWSPKASCNLAGCSRLSVLIFMLFVLLSTIILPAIEKNLKDMSYEEAAKKYKEITQVYSFLKTDNAGKYPWSMNEFFDHSIYERLVGNEFFGYYYDEGVKYDNPGNLVAIDTIAVIKGRGYETYKDRYTRIFLQVLKLSEKHTYHIKKEARYSIGICIVSLKEKDDAESIKGIVLESYIKDRETGKHFYHRFGTGSPGDLDQSLRLSAVRIICNLEFLKAHGVGSRRSRFAPSRRTPPSDRKIRQACRPSPERLANPEQEGLAQGETLPKMRAFLGKVKGMTTTACPINLKEETR